MKERKCDSCNKVIPKGNKYIKASESEVINQVQRLNHKGDICLYCWDKIKEKSK